MKKIRLFFYWWARRRGRLTVDFEKGCGHYLRTGLLGWDPKLRTYEMKMESGKTGLYQLVDYELYRDPPDMVKSSRWQLLGYKGEKRISDCTFKEFLKIYHA